MHTAHLPTTCFNNHQMSAVVVRDPQVNKFEQVSSIGRHMSLAGGSLYSEVRCLGEGAGSRGEGGWVWGEGIPNSEVPCPAVGSLYSEVPCPGGMGPWVMVTWDPYQCSHLVASGEIQYLIMVRWATCEQTDRYDWKHYMPTASLAGGKYSNLHVLITTVLHTWFTLSYRKTTNGNFPERIWSLTSLWERESSGGWSVVRRTVSTTHRGTLQWLSKCWNVSKMDPVFFLNFLINVFKHKLHRAFMHAKQYFRISQVYRVLAACASWH